MKRSIVLISLLLVIVSSQAQSLKYWYIADAKIPCDFGNIRMSCLQVRSSPDSVWRPFQYEIEGFVWEPGIEAFIEVEVTPLLKPGKDGAKETYKYLRTVEVKNTVLKQKEIIGASRWNLINIQSSTTPIPRVKQAKAWIEFNLDSSRFFGFGGCNHYSGNFSLKDGEINFGVVESTLMSCTNESIEKILYESINGNTQFYLRNRMLFITCQNGYTLHFRSEKKIDSLISELSRPRSYRGNLFGQLKDSTFDVSLDDVADAGNRDYRFIKDSLTSKEKLTIAYKLINMDGYSNVVELHILNLPTKNKDIYQAVVIFNDGTRKEIMIRHVF